MSLSFILSVKKFVKFYSIFYINIMRQENAINEFINLF